MDIAVFDEFSEKCSKELPNEIDKILQHAKGEKACTISFITTDDFYGFYIAWDYSTEIDAYFEWENGSNPDFLYQPLVDIVEADEEFVNRPMKNGILPKRCFLYWKRIFKKFQRKSLKRTVSKEKTSYFLPPWGMAIILKKCLKHQ